MDAEGDLVGEVLEEVLDIVGLGFGFEMGGGEDYLLEQG